MRLLFTTTDGANAFNGINGWLLEFLPALVRAGHSPSVLVFSWSEPRHCATAARLRERGIPTQIVFPMLYTEAAVRRCINEAVLGRYDVFIANHVLPAILAIPAVQNHGIPTVTVLHNDDDEYRTKAAFTAGATVAVSQRILGSIPRDGRLSRCIPYGVPTPSRVARRPLAGEPLRLIYHGRIARHQKRILETAAALVRVCRQHPNLTADLLGAGPDEAALKQQLLADDANGRVRYLGPLPVERLREVLADYHCAVLLSDFEGLPVSILEAMSAGLVPICLNIESGLPELLKHGQNGLLVTDRDGSFDSAVARLVEQKVDWQNLSDAARATISSGFSFEACVAHWEELFVELKSRPPHTRSLTALAAPHPHLLAEDRRHPGFMRAWWRWIRFGKTRAARPW